MRSSGFDFVASPTVKEYLSIPRPTTTVPARGPPPCRPQTWTDAAGTMGGGAPGRSRRSRWMCRQIVTCGTPTLRASARAEMPRASVAIARRARRSARGRGRRSDASGVPMKIENCARQLTASHTMVFAWRFAALPHAMQRAPCGQRMSTIARAALGSSTSSLGEIVSNERTSSVRSTWRIKQGARPLQRE